MYEKNPDGYYKNRHSCFLLSYHLVLVTKYRKPVLTGVVLQTVKDVILSVMKERGCIVHEINGEADHLHVMFDAGPEVNLLDLVRVVKTKSSRFCRSRHKNEVEKYYWKPYFWSDSYFITSIGESTRLLVQKYIQNQGSDH